MLTTAGARSADSVASSDSVEAEVPGFAAASVGSVQPLVTNNRDRTASPAAYAGNRRNRADGCVTPSARFRGLLGRAPIPI